MIKEDSTKKEESTGKSKRGRKLSKHKQAIIYTAPKSTHESRRITASEHVRGDKDEWVNELWMKELMRLWN